MGKQLRRFSTGLAVTGALACAAAFALPLHSMARPAADPIWQPIPHDLSASPARVLPKIISETHPVRVVSTTIDPDGRPVVTVRTATDRDAATGLVVAGQDAPGAVSVETDVEVSAAEVDPLLPAQWDLARIRVDAAWPRSTGAGVTVAVVDSGVDSAHPDLAGQVLPGADFITGTEGASIDPNGHGTHVAGTIAALAANGEGVAGVAPGAHILPVRVLGADGNGYMSDVANGIAYAADHGADVINLSVSATVQVAAVTNAVAYARSKGVVVIAAAGNARRSGSPTSFPAADPGVIAVAATAGDDSIAPYSNQGAYVDVAAPGSDITSTYPGNRYGRMSGTSMATPHVAAVAALLKAADRALSPDQVELALTSSAVDLGAPGRDDDFGAGRIDAAAALATVPTPAAAPTTPEMSPAITPTESAPTTPEPSPTMPAEPTPTQPEPTQPEPTQPQPTTPAQSPAPTTEATPTPTPSATPAEPVIRLVRPGAGKLTVVIVGADGEPAQIQRWVGGDWETVVTYPAVRVARFTDLTPGVVHRVVVAGTTSFEIRL